jgi:uncharacterized protein YbjT (DUF2867 family)
MRTQPRIAIVGANGTVGRLALQYALAHPAIGRITAIAARELGILHPKLQEIVLPDFGNCSSLAEGLTNQDAVVFCPDSFSSAEFALIEFAEVLYRGSPNAAFAFLSSGPSHPNEPRRLRSADSAQLAENTILAIGFPRVYIFRPRCVHPVQPPRDISFRSRIWGQMARAFRAILPDQMIRPDDLARAMVEVTVQGMGQREDWILENHEIRSIAGSYRLTEQL